MRIVYGKSLSEKDEKTVQSMAEECGILFDTARLLFYRGIDSPIKAKEFLNPSVSCFLNPLNLSGMKNAVDRLFLARDNCEKALICGDYDTDGICASAILFHCLKSFGIESTILIPEREDGYGINAEKTLDICKQNGITLLITVDCGISERETVELLKENGIDVIVTDHHEPPEELPECIIINPKLPNDKYGFNGLCGASVSYKLGYALIGDRANSYLDFVALATVADSMELTGENRSLVYEGLKLFSPQKIRDCFKALLGDYAKPVTSQTLAYLIAPRINAGGRMGNARLALDLFLSETEDEIFDLAVKLNSFNIARQNECDEIYKSAKEKIIKSGAYKRNAIMVYDKEWKAGFVGIVASKLLEEFCRPVIVFAGADNLLRGSARSTDFINVYDAICFSKEFTETFGGHAQAAGVTVKEENFDAFYNKIDEFLSGKINPDKCEKEIYVDWKTQSISLRFAREIERLEPFGIGNRKPLFSLTCNTVKPTELKPNSPHYSFNVDDFELLYFNGVNDISDLTLPVNKEIVYEPNYSIFKGKEYIKGFVKKIIADYFSGNVSLYAFRNELKRPCFETDNLPIEKCKDYFNDTLIIESDEKEAEKFLPFAKDLPVSYFYPLNSGKTSACISPTTLPKYYKKAVYLYRPLSIFNDGMEEIVMENAPKLNSILSLPTDRDTFAEVFSLLKIFNGRAFVNSANFYSCNSTGLDANTFVFCTEVFLELNIFSVIDGRLIFNPKVKNSLNNSNLYNAVVKYKEKTARDV